MTQDPSGLGVSVIPWRDPSADPPPDNNQLIAVVTKHGENTRTSTTQASWVVDSPEDYIAWAELPHYERHQASPDNLVTWRRYRDEQPNTAAPVLVQFKGSGLTYAGIYIGLNEIPNFKDLNGNLLELAHNEDLWAYLPTPPKGI